MKGSMKISVNTSLPNNYSFQKHLKNSLYKQKEYVKFSAVLTLFLIYSARKIKAHLKWFLFLRKGIRVGKRLFHIQNNVLFQTLEKKVYKRK